MADGEGAKQHCFCTASKKPDNIPLGTSNLLSIVVDHASGGGMDMRDEVSKRTITLRFTGEKVELPEYRIYWLAKIVYSTQFELTIAFVIIVNAIALATLTFPGIPEQTQALASNLDQIAFTVYVVELMLRIISYGKKPWMFFRNGWNVFDFVVISMAPFFQGQTAILRLLRLLRLVRIFRFLPEVRVLTSSIIKSMLPLLSMSVLIALLLFLYGMAGTYLFGTALPDSWGNIVTSLKSLFVLLTLENFPDYFEEALGVSLLALPFFITYVFIIVFTVLNVLIGIVLHAMDQARDELTSVSPEVENLQHLSEQVQEAIKDGHLSKREAVKLRDELNAMSEELDRKFSLSTSSASKASTPPEGSTS